MKYLFLTWVCLTAICQPAPAQSPPVQLDPVLHRVYPGTWELAWDSVDRRTYFMQWSEDLSVWHYFPEIEFGDGLPLSWCLCFGTGTGSGRIQVRLRYLDVATTDPDLADFDNDGLPNLAELQMPGKDPLIADTGGADTDTDGMPDALELFYWGNLSKTGTGDEDGDGISNALELQAGQTPASDQTATAEGRSNYFYDVMGRFDSSNGVETFNPQFDAEGNLLNRE